MPLKKKKKTTRAKTSKQTNGGLTKFATFTTDSISKAFVNYKKNKELQKIKEIKLKKLQENNQIIKDKKELKLLEDKLKKKISKLNKKRKN